MLEIAEKNRKEQRAIAFQKEKEEDRNRLRSLLPGIIEREQNMETTGVFSLSFVHSSPDITCTPFPTKLDAYLALKRSNVGNVMVYAPKKEVFALADISSGSIFSSERVESSLIFTLPSSILSQRLDIPSLCPCPACEPCGHAAVHIYGGQCKRLIETF